VFYVVRVVATVFAAVVAFLALRTTGLFQGPSIQEATMRFVGGGQIPVMAPFLSTEAVEKEPSWSPDGSLIAYVSDLGGNDDIWICDASGSNPINLTAGHEGVDDFPVWAPDGRQIAFYSDRDGPGIYTMTTLGGDVRRRVQVSPGVRYTFSLDWSENGDLVYTDFDGSGAKQVYRLTNSEFQPRCLTCLLGIEEGQSGALSPSGEFLVFKSTETGGRGALFLVDLRSSEVVPIEEGVDRPQWTADGRAVLFLSARSGTSDLWFVGVDPERGAVTHGAQRVTSGRDFSDFDLNSGGSRVLAVHKNSSANLWVLPAFPQGIPDVAVGEPLTRDDFSNRRPRWFSGGESIVFQSNRRGSTDIWTLPASGGAPSRLTTGSGIEHRPRPSREDSWIAYEPVTQGIEHLFTMRRDGSQAHVITEELRSRYSATCCADWSPDGSQLAFFGNGLGSAGARLVIATMDSSTGTALEIREFDLPGEGEEYFRWSPDGNWISYETNLHGHWDIWVVAADGTDPRPITSDPGNERSSTWSSDGKWLYFRRDELGTLWRVPMSRDGRPGGAAEQWLDPGPRARVSADGLDFLGDSAVISIETVRSDIWMLTLGEQGG
jgi:Tol biopolymer transport system component